jgi:hypothetical protein
MFATPRADAIVAAVLKRKPMHRRFLTRSVAGLSDGEKTDVEHYIAFMEAQGWSHDALADAYLLIVDDTFKEEMRFRQTGRYRFSTFDETRAEVYDNADYMRGYMVGLALSSFWWTNHVRLRRFFAEQLPALGAHGGMYREIGPGHGIYFVDALRSGLFAAYEGIDVSATSIDLTRRLLADLGYAPLPPAQLLHADFLESRNLPLCQLLVMGEVLEHVEHPGAFLDRAFACTAPAGRVYLTTCINAPAIDHLYNPGSIEALEALFAAHGFDSEVSCAFGRDDLSVQHCEKERLAVNVGYVLRKRGAPA